MIYGDERVGRAPQALEGEKTIARGATPQDSQAQERPQEKQDEELREAGKERAEEERKEELKN